MISFPTGRLLLQPQDRVLSDSLRPVGRLHVYRKDLGEILVRNSLHRVTYFTMYETISRVASYVYL